MNRTMKRHEQFEHKSLADMQVEDAARRAVAKTTSKTATLITAGSAPDGSGGDATNGLVAAPSHPTPEQLAVINGFTRTPKTADQLYVFDTLSCNDLPDRDDDFFTANCVDAFAALPQPFSPVGKSYMVDHAYKTENARGRIFAATTKDVETEAGKAKFLVNSIYVPATAQYADFIESLDFGISWAVSVGVTIGKTFCSVCDAPFSSWGYWCSEGHDKGYYYDPNSTETDSYGWPIPVQSTQAGAVKCLQGFDDPKDFYELSQVFLGAQYFAALDKEAGIDFATAKTAGGFLSVPAKLAKTMPFSHEPERVREARAKQFEITETESGALKWVDADGLGWTFNPFSEDDAVLCTGKEVDTEIEEDDETEKEVIEDGTEPEVRSDELRDPEGGGVDQEDVPDQGAGEGGEGTQDGSEEVGGPTPVDADADPEGGEGEEDDEEEDPEVEAATSSSPKSAGRFLALLPDEAQDTLKGGKLTFAVLSDALAKHITALTKDAEYGRRYKKELRTEALDWFVRANSVPGSEGVQTNAFEKMLDAISDDVDLLLAVIEEQRGLAQKRFPSKAVRRSSFPADPSKGRGAGAEEVANYEESLKDAASAQKVSRLHGTQGR